MWFMVVFEKRVFAPLFSPLWQPNSMAEMILFFNSWIFFGGAYLQRTICRWLIYLVGGWPTPLKKIVSWNDSSQYMEKKHVPNHQPVVNLSGTLKRILIAWSHPSESMLPLTAGVTLLWRWFYHVRPLQTVCTNGGFLKWGYNPKSSKIRPN